MADDDLTQGVTFRAHEIEFVQLDSIEPHPQNPNEGDVGAISESVDEVGFVDPMIVQLSSRRILSGEHRWHTLRQHGEPAGPVIFVDLDDEQALRYMIGANEIGRRRSRSRGQLLSELLVDLQQQSEHGVRGTGFDDDDVDKLLNSLANERRPIDTGAAPVEPPPREIPVGIGFRFGDYSGWVSQTVYEAFRAAYEAKREESGEVMLDDVLSVWLDL